MDFVYPYRRKDGYCSILEAVDREDAFMHLKAVHGKGTVFCEVALPIHEVHAMYGEKICEHVGKLLSENRNFKV